MDQAKALLFEIAWEVCNQVGGIYTVIKTKTPAMLGRNGADYFLIGPYNPEQALLELEETSPPEPILSALSELGRLGINGHFGRWLVKGRPQVILFDYRPRFNSLDKDKYFLWKDHFIGTPPGDAEINAAVAFGYTVADFFRFLCTYTNGRPVVAHFHEWLTGVTILRLRHMRVPLSIIFTTHATILGRYIAAGNPRFYLELDSIEPYSAARYYNIESRFSIERAAAHGADFFTTISDITSREAERFLARKPDHILPNGLNIERFVAVHELQNLHRSCKEKIHEFIMGHFFPSYTFELEHTLYFFTSGRYEYRNKGMDLFIEAIYRLNERLKQTANPPTVVAFIITRAATRSLNMGALQRHLMFEELKSTCDQLEAGIAEKILLAAAQGRLPKYEEMLPSDFQDRLKRAILARRADCLPAIVTHDLVDDANDPVMRHLRHRNLFNAATDPVKVVFHPEFINAGRPLFNMDYEHFVRGCHLGIFPSYYEPWGYTPLECLALGIPAVTTDLTGFGDFALQEIPRPAEQGLFILRRSNRNPDEAVEALAGCLFDFCQLSRRERIDLRNKAQKLSELFDWNKLASFYHQVHEEAVAKLTGEDPGVLSCPLPKNAA